MDIADIENVLLKIVAGLAGQLPSDQLQDMSDLVAAGESGVAFENLCTQIYEFDIRVDSTVLADLQKVGAALGVKPTYWQRLEGIV